MIDLPVLLFHLCLNWILSILVEMFCFARCLFLTASTYVFIVWWLLGGVHFLFLFCLNILLSSSFVLFGVSLKYAFSLICLKKSFKSASSSCLLYTFGVGIKFKFLFKSLYSTLVNEYLVNKLIIFPFGLD